MSRRLRVLELFCGIGGCAAALGDSAEVVAAIDIDRTALDVYAANFAHATQARTIESIPAHELAAFDAEFWWLSPPCQPFTRRGAERDLADPRCQALLTLIERIRKLRPPLVALENVPGFAESNARQRLLTGLNESGYRVHEMMICPTQLGVPNRRRRYYLVARQAGWNCEEMAFSGESPQIQNPVRARTLGDFLDVDVNARFDVAPQLLADYSTAINLIDAEDPQAITACFTSAYGKSPIRSGSYVRQANRIRRFTPREIARLLGFPPTFGWPPHTADRTAWRLLGNSLAVHTLRYVLSHFLPNCRQDFRTNDITTSDLPDHNRSNSHSKQTAATPTGINNPSVDPNT